MSFPRSRTASAPGCSAHHPSHRGASFCREELSATFKLALLFGFGPQSLLEQWTRPPSQIFKGRQAWATFQGPGRACPHGGGCGEGIRGMAQGTILVPLWFILQQEQQFGKPPMMVKSRSGPVAQEAVAGPTDHGATLSST